MATESIKYLAPDTENKAKTQVFPRPGQHTTGLIDWLTTIDHKKIGLMYGMTALFFLIVGGLEALLIRSQLWDHNMDVLTNRQYNQMFTMHGTTMVFLVIMPLSAAFFNFIMPLQIGARDVAYGALWEAGSFLILVGFSLVDPQLSDGLVMHRLPTPALQKLLEIWVQTFGSFPFKSLELLLCSHLLIS